MSTEDIPDYDNQEKIKDYIKHLKEWVKKQPHLKVREDEIWLRAFIVGCKMKVELAKQKLDAVYTYRSMSPEFFTGRDPLNPTIQKALDFGTILYLQNKNDPSMIFVRAANWDPSIVTREDIVKTHLIVVDVILLHLSLTNRLKHGIEVIFDYKSITVEQNYPPALLIKLTKLLSMPCRFVRVYALNKPIMLSAAWEIAKLVLPPNKRDRFSEINNYDDLFKNVNQKLFPKEFGGQNGTIAELTVEMKKMVESYRDWLLGEEKYGCDEKLRPGKPKTYEELFGMEGSFRKLNID